MSRHTTPVINIITLLVPSFVLQPCFLSLTHYADMETIFKCTDPSHRASYISIKHFCLYRQIKNTANTLLLRSRFTKYSVHKQILQHSSYASFLLYKSHGLWNSEVQYRIHKSVPIIPIISRINTIPRTENYFFKIHPNIVLPTPPRLS